jgi:hypothetical protein
MRVSITAIALMAAVSLTGCRGAARSRWTAGPGKGGHGAKSAAWPGATAVCRAPLLALQFAAAGLGPQAAPLLEEERDARSFALVPDVTNPITIHGARAGTTFSTDNHPINSCQVEPSYRPDQRLDGKKANSGRRLLEVPHARQLGTVLHGYTEPHVHRPGCVAVTLAKEIAHERGALAEDLVGVPIGPLHGVKDARDKFVRDFLVKEIAHGIHEDHSRLPPPERLLQPLGPQGQIKSGLKGMARRATKALRKSLGVTVVAPGADLGAAGYRIPRRIGPLDCC